MPADPMFVSSPKKYFSEEADSSIELNYSHESQHYISPETSQSQLLDNELTAQSSESFEEISTTSPSTVSADKTETIFELEGKDRDNFLSSSTTVNKSECYLSQGQPSLIRLTGNHELRTINQEETEEECRQRVTPSENTFEHELEQKKSTDTLASEESEEWDILSADSDMDFFLKNYPLIKGTPHSPLSKRTQEEPKRTPKMSLKIFWNIFGKVAIPTAISLLFLWAFRRSVL